MAVLAMVASSALGYVIVTSASVACPLLGLELLLLHAFYRDSSCSRSCGSNMGLGLVAEELGPQQCGWVKQLEGDQGFVSPHLPSC